MTDVRNEQPPVSSHHAEEEPHWHPVPSKKQWAQVAHLASFHPLLPDVAQLLEQLCNNAAAERTKEVFILQLILLDRLT
eukprot:gene36310-64076_t